MFSIYPVKNVQKHIFDRVLYNATPIALSMNLKLDIFDRLWRNLTMPIAIFLYPVSLADFEKDDYFDYQLIS